MRSRVDTDRVPTPAAPLSTVENNSSRSSAQPLIKEITMRHTTRVSLVALMVSASCMSQVGEDIDRDGRPDANPEAGCEHPKEVTTPVTIRSDADFAQVPNECWDLYAKLRIESGGIGSLAKLGKLKGVNDLEIVDTNIKTIDTQMPLVVYGAVTVTGNKQLANLTNLQIENADNLTTTYTVRNNALLASLDGLKYIKSVEGELRISDNPVLAEVTFDELTNVTGALTISNTGATRIDLGSLQTTGRLEISSNAKLTRFDGLAASQIKGDFVLRGNTQLATLGTMSSISRIDGSMTIAANAVTNLDAISGLQWITGSLTITDNPQLATLGRMSHLSGIGTTVAVTGNTALPYCLAHEIDHCVNSGVVTITNNKANTQNAQCTCWCGPN